MIALDLAHTRGASASPKVLVLAATPGRHFAEVVHDQLSRLLDKQGATAEQRRYFLDADRKIGLAILATAAVPSDVPPGLRALYPGYLGPYYKSVLALDPAELAKSFRGPVLVVNGMADVQVSSTRDAAIFGRLLAGRRDGSEVFTPSGVSHNLKTVHDGDEHGIEGPVDPRVTDKILRWLARTL